jgi:hypothetical protein
MRRAPEDDPAPAVAIEPSPRLDDGISPIDFIRGGVKSKMASCAPFVFSGVGLAGAGRFKIEKAVASDRLGAPEGLSCAAAVKASNRTAKTPDKNA